MTREEVLSETVQTIRQLRTCIPFRAAGERGETELAVQVKVEWSALRAVECGA